MEKKEAKQIIELLAEGIDPRTGGKLPENFVSGWFPSKNGTIARINHLNTIRMSIPLALALLLV